MVCPQGRRENKFLAAASGMRVAPNIQRQSGSGSTWRKLLGLGWRKADSEFIFKPKWVLQLPERSRRLLGRIEIGIWSDTCQETCRLPNGQGFRWLKARTVSEGSHGDGGSSS